MVMQKTNKQTQRLYKTGLILVASICAVSLAWLSVCEFKKMTTWKSLQKLVMYPFKFDSSL